MPIVGALRVVVYAEGPGEAPRSPVGAGSVLPDDELGPAHLLVRRMVADGTPLPDAAVCFLTPQLVRARHARGSDLLVPDILRELLISPRTGERTPHVAVVLVHRDGDPSRAELVRTVPDLAYPPLRAVLGLAREEFESWLIGDGAALRREIGVGAPTARPEALAPGDAKRWLADHSGEREPWSVRRALVASLNLTEPGRRCPRFAAFRAQLRAVANAILHGH